MTLLNQVMKGGRAAIGAVSGTAQRGAGLYGRGVDQIANTVEGTMLAQLNKNAGAAVNRRLRTAQQDFGPIFATPTPEARNVIAQMNQEVLQGNARKAQRASNVTRFAGSRILPLAALPAAGLGVIAASNGMEQRALNERLAAQGMTPEEAEMLSNQLLYG